MKKITSEQRVKLEECIDRFFQSDQWVNEPKCYISEDTVLILSDVVASTISAMASNESYIRKEL